MVNKNKVADSNFAVPSEKIIIQMLELKINFISELVRYFYLY
jgi:hypothetical protein